MQTLEFRLVPDTNLLRARDEKLAFFSADFVKAIADRVGVTKRAFVCEITANEIVYQKTTIAQSNLDKLTGAAKSLYALSGQEIKVHDLGELRVHVQSQLKREMKSTGLDFLPTPITEIDWLSVVEDAVWRRPPFEGNAESKNEKGFRDAVFVHTVLSAVKKEPHADWCVLTNDSLVYQRLDAEAKGAFKSLMLFRTTEEFLGHVELRVQKFEVALASNLQAKAHIAFYDPSIKTGFVQTANVEKLIHDKYRTNIETVPKTQMLDVLKGSFTQLLTPIEFWFRESVDQLFLEGTRFSKRETEIRIQWITRVRMCAVFRNSITPNTFAHSSSVIRDIRFDVHWSADVTNEKFTNAAIGDIVLISNERITDSAFTRMQLGLPIPENSVYSNVSTLNLSTNVAVPSGVAPQIFDWQQPITIRRT